MTSYSTEVTSFYVVVVSLLRAHLIAGHAHVEVPPARNWVSTKMGKGCLGGQNCPDYPQSCAAQHEAGCLEYNWYSLQAGGPGAVKKRANGKWPSTPESHGLCGDPVQDRGADASFFEPWRKQQYMIPTPPQVTYKAGETVEFLLNIHAHHMGFFEFRICDTGLDGSKLESVQAGEDCLNKWILKRAPPDPSCKPNERADCQPMDELHPSRWHLPNGMYDSVSAAQSRGFPSTVIVAGQNWNDSIIERLRDDENQLMGGSYYKMRFIIPEGLSCTHCTMQWWWVSGNQCLYDKDVITYMNRMKELGWQKFTTANAVCADVGAYGEEFWNCADFAVTGPPSPTPGPTPPRRRSKQRRRSARRRRSTRRRRRRGARRRRTTRRRK